MHCIYCNQREAVTKDHIPPKCIFPSHTRRHLITVPSCVRCNNEYSADDEFFRLGLAISIGYESEEARQLTDMASRSIAKNNRLNSLLDEMILYMDNDDVAYDYSKIGPYMIKELERITKGIYFSITKEPLALDTKIEIYDEFKENNPPNIFEEGEVSPYNKVTHPNIFSCSYWMNPDDRNSGIWKFNFYNRFFPYAITLSPTLQRNHLV